MAVQMIKKDRSNDMMRLCKTCIVLFSDLKMTEILCFKAVLQSIFIKILYYYKQFNTAEIIIQCLFQCFLLTNAHVL